MGQLQKFGLKTVLLFHLWFLLFTALILTSVKKAQEGGTVAFAADLHSIRTRFVDIIVNDIFALDMLTDPGFAVLYNSDRKTVGIAETF